MKALLTTLTLYTVSRSRDERVSMRRRLTSHPEIYFIITVYIEGSKSRTISLPIDIFCLHTISLVRYNCTVWFGASHNCPPLFAQHPHRKRKIKEKKQVELRRYGWPRAPTELPRIPVAISFRQLDLFGMYFYRIGQSAPKLDISLRAESTIV